jgi:hypothetical protein
MAASYVNQGAWQGNVEQGAWQAQDTLPTLYGAAELVADVALTASGSRVAFGAASFAADVAVVAEALRRTFSAADLAAAAALAAEGKRRTFSAADFAVDAALGVDGHRKTFGAGALTGDVALAVDGARVAFGSAAFEADVALAASAMRRGMGAAGFLASVALDAEGNRIAFGGVSLAADVILSAAATGGQVLQPPKQIRRPCRSVLALRQIVTNAGSVNALVAEGQVENQGYLLKTTAKQSYLRLNGANGPLTGGLEVQGTLNAQSLKVDGDAIAGILTATAALNFGSIAASESADLTIALVGAAAGDVVMLGLPAGSISGGTGACDNVAFTAWVSAADTVTVRASNNDATDAADLASGTYRVTILKY